MNSTGRLIVCGLLAPVLATSAGEAELRFAPRAGSKLEKVLEAGYDFTLDDFSLVVDGQDVGEVMGGFDLSVSGEGRVVVLDEYVELMEGKPKELLRTFDELASSTTMELSSDFGSQDQAFDGTSELEGRTVRFLWDDEQGEYVKTYEDGASDDLLDGLREDMDFRGLLPRGPVSEGDSWDVPLRDLHAVVAPGGNMRVVPSEADMGGDWDEMEDFAEMVEDKLGELADLFEGTCTCTYVGPSSLDPDLAEIAFEAQIEADLDLSDMLDDLVDLALSQAGEGEEIPDFSIDHADVSIELEGSGTLLWHRVERRVSSLSYTLDAVLSLDFAASMEVADESHDAELFLEMSGSTSQSLSARE